MVFAEDKEGMLLLAVAYKQAESEQPKFVEFPQPKKEPKWSIDLFKPLEVKNVKHIPLW